MSHDQIILMFRNKEEGGYIAVYDMLFGYMASFANSIIKDIDEAKDIAITILQSAFEKPDEFHSFEKLKAYLILSVKNKCLSIIDKEKRHRRSHAEMAFIAYRDNDEYIEAQLVRSELLNQIYLEIKNLPPVRRKVFEMIYIEGLTADEVSERLNMRRDAVYVNVSKAIKELRIAVSDWL